EVGRAGFEAHKRRACLLPRGARRHRWWYALEQRNIPLNLRKHTAVAQQQGLHRLLHRDDHRVGFKWFQDVSPAVGATPGYSRTLLATPSSQCIPNVQ